jgi:NADH:ubiquinone oxidoreductase subunit F (NADH-binding)
MSLPRLLAGVHLDRPVSLSEHLALHGPSPRNASGLIERVDRAGLRGRGGAGFPAAVKLRSVAGRRGPRALLVNAAEGDPMSAKDRVLLETAPHLVLDGALAAAAGVGAGSIAVAVPEGATAAHRALETALRERGGPREIRVLPVPVAYLAGEERALIAFLDGRPLRPTSVPPRPFERGLRRRPTLVQNPETLAHMALIDRHGPAWFRELGIPDHPGSALITVAGAVRRPGVQEIACGASLSSVLAVAGEPREPLRAVLVGGCHGVWIGAAELERVTLDDVGLADHGGSLGAGVVVALGRSACPAQELAHAIGYLAEQSAGQCGPCSHGLPAIAELLAMAVNGRARPDARRRLDRWSRDLPGRGACHLPDGAMRVLRSGMRVFAAEIAAHERGRCQACRRPPTLRLPRAGMSAAA